MHPHCARILGIAIAALAAAGSAAPAAADLYRCTGPGGELIFTDDKSSCPGAAKHDPQAELQTIPADGEPPVAAPERDPRDSYARRDDHERAQKAQWQQKKRSKEEELRFLRERHDQLGQYVKACNRGAEIIGRDETGIKYRISCDRIRHEYAENEARQEPLREYLETGLQRECRQSGCLPGWIR
jgi:hypothetical protein